MLGTATLQKLHNSNLTQQFYRQSADELLHEYARSGQKIELQGSKRTLDLFHLAAEYIPAYKDFLHKNHINHQKIKTVHDYLYVPVMTKKNYLIEYPLNDMSWQGKIEPNYIYSSSSGSTGKPFLWPRGEQQELEGALQHELMFRQFFGIERQSTLYVNCFAMGTWVAGTFVLASIEKLSQKGYPIISIAPGIEKQLALTLIKELAGNYDQIILGGYPPFIKDLLDLGIAEGFDWTLYKIRFLFAAEGFSEAWRDHINRIVGHNSLDVSLNCYGSADAGLLAHETPLTVAIRRFALQAGKKQELYGTERIPTLAQYDPRLKYFEELEGKLIFTANAGLPLIRYDIGDEGRIASYATMMDTLNNLAFDDESKSFPSWQLPFIQVFGRSDLTVSLYGLLVYPEHIKHGLENVHLLSKVSGKFVMSIEYDDRQSPYLLIRIELLQGVKATAFLKQEIQKAITRGLTEVNTEYARLKKEMGSQILPVVGLIEQGSELYFKPGSKQRWVQR